MRATAVSEPCPVPVSDAAVEAFAADGAVCLRDVIDRYWLELLAEGVERNLASPGPRGAYADGEARRFFQDSDNWDRIPELEEFVRRSPAAAMAGVLMGATKVNFLHDHVLVKEPGAAKATIWHQDQPYSPVDGSQFLAVWIPLDPVGRDATLEFVLGSHRWGHWYRPQRFADGALRADDDDRWAVLPDIDGHRGYHRVAGWALEPGDCLAFHGLMLHSAPGNVSAVDRRRAVTTRWTGDDARFRRRSGEMSPPPPATGPADGGILDCRAFPVVARRAEDGVRWVW